MSRSIVADDLDADRKDLVIITGANQGGKSSLLRSVGVAQLMMHAGMFVAAESFAGELCAGLFTHYKREEDATMKSGKLDEELSRMSGITDAITPNSMLLLNESFASTNECEGSEIARQVVRALLDRRVKVFFVVHLYDFAHACSTRSWATPPSCAPTESPTAHAPSSWSTASRPRPATERTCTGKSSWKKRRDATRAPRS